MTSDWQPEVTTLYTSFTPIREKIGPFGYVLSPGTTLPYDSESSAMCTVAILIKDTCCVSSQKLRPVVKFKRHS